MATSPLGPGDISLRDFIEAIGSADAAHGAVSTAAVAGGLGSSLLLMVAALPQTRSDSVADRAKLVEAAEALAGMRQQLMETIETETAVKTPQLPDGRWHRSSRQFARSTARPCSWYRCRYSSSPSNRRAVCRLPAGALEPDGDWCDGFPAFP